MQESEKKEKRTSNHCTWKDSIFICKYCAGEYYSANKRDSTIKEEENEKETVKNIRNSTGSMTCVQQACGSTASTTTEDNTVNSETKEASTEQASVVQSQETAEVSQDDKETSVDNFTVTYLDDWNVMCLIILGMEKSYKFRGK